MKTKTTPYNKGIISAGIPRLLVLATVMLAAILPASAKKESLPEHTSRYYATRAENFEKSGTWEAAKREIDEGLQYYPNDPDLRYLNGRYYYYALGDLNNARYNLTKAIQENDQHYQAKRVLVDVEDDSKHYSSSICYINELLEFQPYDRDLWRRKIALYNKIGQKVEADNALERLARIYPNDSVVRTSLANRNREKWSGRLNRTSLSDEATELERYLEIDPGNLEYYLQLANVYYQLGQIERAIGIVNQGLKYHPGNGELVRKAASMMAELGNYTRALNFLKEHRTTGPLYNQLMTEAMNDARMHDAYDMSGRVYATTKNRDALTYLVNTSIVRGYYPDAIEYLQEAYRVMGERPDLLMKHYGLEKRFGNDAKALQVLERLFKVTPTDPEVIDEYTDMMLALTDHDVTTSQWDEALLHINKALGLMNPDTVRWPAVVSRKIGILGQLNRVGEAKNLFLDASDQMPQYRKRFGAAYEEVASVNLKKLMDEEEYERALEEAQDLLNLVDDSEAALRACVSMSETLQRDDLFQKYTAMGYDRFPNSPYFITKRAAALRQMGKEKEALALLMPEKYSDQYVNPQLKNAYAGMSEELARELLKNHQPEEAMIYIDRALKYDPDNKEILYLKGLAYEQMHDWYKAWEYQYRNYNPSNAEQHDWLQHMRYMRYKSFRNLFDVVYNGAFYDTRNEELATIGHFYSIASIAYTRLCTKNSYTGQISIKGVDGAPYLGEYAAGGLGLEFMAQWNHTFNSKWEGYVNASFGTRFFNKVGANVGATLNLKHGWSTSLRLGYRLTSPTYVLRGNEAQLFYDYKRYNLFLLTPGVDKDWGRIKTGASVDLLAMNKGFFYNVNLKGKIFINEDNISSVGVLLGFGSFPELTFFDQTAMDTLTHTNAMVGAEGMFLITNNFALSINGNWHIYYNPASTDEGATLIKSYRNIFSLNIGLHVAF